MDLPCKATGEALGILILPSCWIAASCASCSATTAPLLGQVRARRPTGQPETVRAAPGMRLNFPQVMRPGLQPGERPEADSAAAGAEALEPDDAAGAADQYLCERGLARKFHPDQAFRSSAFGSASPAFLILKQSGKVRS
jgi:hypothetical protein